MRNNGKLDLIETINVAMVFISTLFSVAALVFIFFVC
jgi:hypothetical protein